MVNKKWDRYRSTLRIRRERKKELEEIPDQVGILKTHKPSFCSPTLPSKHIEIYSSKWGLKPQTY